MRIFIPIVGCGFSLFAALAPAGHPTPKLDAALYALAAINALFAIVTAITDRKTKSL